MTILIATTLDFRMFAEAIAKQFRAMSDSALYQTAATKEELWGTYLGAFPAGSNPIYRERTEYDCQCCKTFIRKIGGVVALIDGKMVSIWDITVDEPAYQTVADAMSALVKSRAIDNVFLHYEATVGTAQSFEQLLAGERRTWKHFSLTLPKNSVVAKSLIGPKLSDYRSTFDVLKRGLTELTLDSVDTVLELIAQNSLYRGDEYKAMLEAFRQYKVAFDSLHQWEPDFSEGEPLTSSMTCGVCGEDGCTAAKDAYCWHLVGQPDAFQAALRIRNTAIGTLLIDLSGPTKQCELADCACHTSDYRHVGEPLDLEDAVRKFETSIMAPSNYKRPTALVSKAQIEKAKKTIEELGLTSALERRYAHIGDITINNVLFADRKTKLRGDVFDELAGKVPEKSKNLDKVEEIGIEDFLKNVLPKATSLEVMVENRYTSNLVSLIAPVDLTAKPLFKWPNNFSWSYNGEMADSIKERVKAAGGSIIGDLCCRLAWDYTDDLDFHMQEPEKAVASSRNSWSTPIGSSAHIYYGNVRLLSHNGGMLDLDANGCDGMKAQPAENIFYKDKSKMAEGVYELYVHNYARRTSEIGFQAEVEFDNQIYSFVYPKAVPQGGKVVVAKIQYSKKDGFKILESLPSSVVSKKMWNVDTQVFRKVSAVMLSPNYWWDEEALRHATRGAKGQMADMSVMERGAFGIGNKHYFFMLDSCRNEGKARGFFNEFLSSALEPHRKTMEMVGAKMKTDESDRQLSGLGFSSTKRDSVLVRVQGAFHRVVKVVF